MFRKEKFFDYSAYNTMEKIEPNKDKLKGEPKFWKLNKKAQERKDKGLYVRY